MATDGKPLVSVYYHDLKGQVIASKQTLPDDALLSQNMTYSFTKQPLEIISEIFKNGHSLLPILSSLRQGRKSGRCESGCPAA